MKIADPEQTTLQEEIPLLLQQLPVRGAARQPQRGDGNDDEDRPLPARRCDITLRRRR